jgi:flagella basal body P-ring formation protein FlgA
MARRLAMFAVGALLALAASSARADEPPRWLEDRVQAFLLERVPEGPVRIAVPPLDAFSLDGVEPDSVEVSITTDAPEPLSGPVPLTIAIARDGHELERRVVTAEVTNAALGVVAARALSRGDVLREEHLTLAPIGNPLERRSAVVDIEDAIGKRMRRNLQSGTPLRASWLEEVPLVKRGEPVRLSVSRGRLRIESTGIARQDGKAGQIVRVENPNSHREVLGRVGEDGVVHVVF